MPSAGAPWCLFLCSRGGFRVWGLGLDAVLQGAYFYGFLAFLSIGFLGLCGGLLYGLKGFAGFQGLL